MIIYNKGDKVRILKVNGANIGCITTVITPNNLRRSWLEVAGGLKDELENAPEWDEVELYTESEPLVAHFVPEVKIVKTIQVKQDGLIVQHAVNSKKQRIVISKNIKIDDLDTLIVMLKQLKEEVVKE